jgi:hypothetical protein
VHLHDRQNKPEDHEARTARVRAKPRA